MLLSRRRPTRARVAVVLALSAALVLPTAARADGRAPAPVTTAVVGVVDPSVELPGVEVLLRLPAVDSAVVRGDAAALAGLRTVPGVTGVTPDVAVELTGLATKKAAPAPVGVLAADELGGRAGKRDAGDGVRVAVVDTGVSDTVALNRASGRLVDGVDTSRAGETGRVETGGEYVDGFGHGTFMANLVAGGAVPGTRAGRALGVAPGATVVVVRVARPDGTTSLSSVLAGLDWVATHPGSVDVANLSLSYLRPGTAYGADPLTEAVQAVREAGVVIVVAAGNTAGLVGDPGFTPEALTVGSVDLRGRRPVVSPFSGSATVAGLRKPDLVASGQSVLSLMPPASVVARANPASRDADGLYRGTGTSMATAVTSGAAALFLAENPGADPRVVKASLRSAADRLDDPRAGAGVLRATTTSRPAVVEPGRGGQGVGDGEIGFDAGSWTAGSWTAGSWTAGSWTAGSWTRAGSWTAGSWTAGSWTGAGSWTAGSWTAGSWTAGSWTAGSWTGLWDAP